MKNFKVVQAFSLLERILIVEGDEIYAEQVRKMFHVYHPKTRKIIGSVSETLFKNYTGDE